MSCQSQPPRILYGQPIKIGMDAAIKHGEIQSRELRGYFDQLHLLSPRESAADVAEQHAILNGLLAELRAENHRLWLPLDDAVGNLLTALELAELVRAVERARPFLGRDASVILVDWPEA